MAISFDQAFGVHEKAVKLRSMRAEVIARNLANADTPGYKAQDIDFKSAMQASMEASGKQGPLSNTDSRHYKTANTSGAMADKVTLTYRQPTQPSIDGNTVETEQELARFARNANDFQASFTLLNNKMKGLVSALRGE